MCYTASFISLPLCLIFKSFLSIGVFPLDWKNSLVVPIPKPTTSSLSSPSNYPPTSLLSLVSKILERHIHSFLFDFCLSHNLLHNAQFGFHPGFSTESALLSTIHQWSSSMDKGKSVCSFFDLSKAFDSVPHIPLFQVLFNLKLPQSLITWFLFYLTILNKL